MGGWASRLECAPGVEEFANERHEEQQHPRHVPEPKQVAFVVLHVHGACRVLRVA